MKTPPMKLFYLVAGILFLIGTLGSIYNLYVVWDKINIGAIVSSISNIIFNIIIVVTFFWLYKLTPSANAQLPTDEVFDEMFKTKSGTKTQIKKSRNGTRGGIKS